LATALLGEHAGGLVREGFREPQDVVDADDADLAAAGLKPAEVRRLRRYLSQLART
jgi:hypothetical protein